MRTSPRPAEKLPTIQPTTHPRSAIHIEAENGIDIRPLCQGKELVGWTDGYKILRRPYVAVTCEDCRRIYREANELRAAVVRALCEGMQGTKGPLNSRVCSEWDSTRRQVVVRLVREDGDVPASEAWPTIKAMAGILTARGFACTRSRTRVRVGPAGRKPNLEPPDIVCRR